MSGDNKMTDEQASEPKTKKQVVWEHTKPFLVLAAAAVAKEFKEVGRDFWYNVVEPSATEYFGPKNTQSQAEDVF